jgi:hypothetical protein
MYDIINDVFVFSTTHNPCQPEDDNPLIPAMGIFSTHTPPASWRERAPRAAMAATAVQLQASMKREIGMVIRVVYGKKI